ncbi:RecQ family ATP-dependent DNA helicase [Lacunimicrobium album]
MPSPTLPKKAYQQLQKYWGYDSFRPLQAEAVSAVLNKQDSLFVLATGAGKSICYQLPALLMPGTAIVVSPLISLMKDQVDTLNANGIPAGFVNSTQSPQEQRDIAQSVKDGNLKLLYVAPERLCTSRMLGFLAGCQISFFAIDEAHCISGWGHDFRTDYRNLSILKSHFPEIGIHGFTATATEQVREDIVEQLHLKSPEVHVGSFDRPNLSYSVQSRNDMDKQIDEVLARHKGESGVIYCLSRKKTEELAELLRAKGHRAKCYHAGLSEVQRTKAQDSFQNQKIDIIVGTVAFGMGIDKSDVRFVIHTGAPKSLENYQQESGRAGRDGLPSECVLIYSRGDFAWWRKTFVELPDEAIVIAENNLARMESYTLSFDCRHRLLVGHFGQPYPHDNCGACDYCLNGAVTSSDSLIIAQKILSCVHRLKEQYGVTYTTQVLLGSREKRILEMRHHELSTYALLKEYDKNAIRNWIDQLISQQCLVAAGEYQQLKILPKGRQVLKGELTPRLSESSSTQTKKAKRAKAVTELSSDEQDLFERLRELRYQLAQERHVPPYVIFADSVLQQIAITRPQTLDDFSTLSGVGAKKLEEYVPLFLPIVQEFCTSKGLATEKPSPTSSTAPFKRERPKLTTRLLEARNYFENSTSLTDAIPQLGVAESTAAGYLADLIELGEISNPARFVDDEVLQRVRLALPEVGDARLTPIFEHLGGDVPYNQIKIALAILRSQTDNAKVTT